MDDKLLVGLIGAIAGGSLTLATSYLTARYRWKEFEYKMLRRSEEGLLSSARSKLNEIYIPLNAKIECLDNSFRSFRKTKSQKDKDDFISSFESLKNIYGSIKQSGETLFLVSEIQDEMEHIIRLICESNNTSKVLYVVVTKIEALGLRASSEKIYPQWFATLFYFCLLFINKMRALVRFTSAPYFIDTTMRTISAPFESEDFYSEFSLTVSAIKDRVKGIALSRESSLDKDNKSAE